MRNIVAGTAGHIDHGKTALVRALTGIDTDRLAEEKRRGISIELGFAHLDLGGGVRIGFVDVPGHERFVRNMLAGVGGIDLVLFVIAADESIKPQTREHFEICRLLGIPKGIIALTKADLVDPDLIGLVRLEVEEYVAGSFLEGAPMVPVSAVTGAGLARLRDELAAAARTVAPKDPSRHFRLPADRAFTMKGFGAVVTGTLMSGRVRPEDEVEAHPLGIRLRVRGVQVHGQAAAEASAGQRTALNLAGPDASRLARGVTLTAPGLFRPATVVDARFELLASARPLKHRAPVHFHAGTSEVVGEARLLEGSGALVPGAEGLVRFVLREPLLLLPGDRFIARMFSPVITIGGGTVLDIDPPAGLSREKSLERLRLLDGQGPADRVSLLVRESPYGLGAAEIVSRTGLLPAEVEEAARDPRVVYLSEPQPWLASRSAFDTHSGRLKEVLGEFHSANPLAPGMPREELRSRELPGSPTFYLEAVLRCARDIVAEGEVVRLASHRLVLKGDEAAALDKIESAFRQAGLTVPPLAEVLARCGVETARARKLLQILLRDAKLVRVSEDLVFHSGVIRDLEGTLAGHKGARFSVPEFKAWTGISRKYAIPLLEYLDREHLTRREGDTRVVL